MKKFPKILAALLVLVTFVGIFAAMPAAAAADYQALRPKTAQLTVGHYTNLALTGEIVQHCAAKNYMEEVSCMVDNDGNGAYWSKPYKFSALKDNGGTTVPVVLIDVANGGDPVTIAGFDMMLRSAFDCQILHFELQATTEANSNKWISILDKKLSVNDWTNRKLRFEFSEVTVYKFRLLVYDIAEANIAKDAYKDYQVCLGDETRFSLAELALLQKREGGSSSSGGSSQKPTQSATQATTRPAFNFPVATSKPTTPAATTPAATTPAATAKPTTPAATTPAATAKPTTPAATTAPVATAKPTTPVATTPGATEATTLVTTPVETLPIDATEPSAPIEETVDPSAPVEETVDPSAPTEEIVDPTEEVVEPTEEVVAPIEPDVTEPTTDNGEEDAPKNNSAVIIIIIAAVVVLAGVVTFIIIRKKKAA